MIKADVRAWTTTLEKCLPSALVVLVWSLSGVSVWALYVTMLLLDGVYLIRNVWRFRRAEGRRQAAVVPASGYRPLAWLQPLPNAAALPVPSTITQQPGWLAYVLSPPVACCVVVFFPLLIAPARVLHPTLSFVAISLLLAGAFSIWILLSTYQRIEIHAEGLTVKSGQTHVQRYGAPLLKRIEAGEIAPSFVITHKRPLADAPEMYKTFRDKKDGCIKVVLKP